MIQGEVLNLLNEHRTSDMMMPLPLREKDFINRIRLRAGRARLMLGIGDDCACVGVPSGHEVLVTTDLSLENVHFNTKLLPAAAIGHRCLLRGLSDIAAMGGIPLAVFLSLALPADLKQNWADNFIGGILKLATKFGVFLAGGDTARSPGKILADIVVVGSVPKGAAILRSGAKVGDRIFVTGTLGGASSTLKRLRGPKRDEISPAELKRYFYPTPRLEIGRILREKGLASSMIDISDGLSTDLSHICEESGVGAEVDAEAVPCASVFGVRDHVKLDLALNGGDDYELLFTSPAKVRVPGRISSVRITEIGRIIKGGKLSLKLENSVRKLLPQGWQHFRDQVP